MDDVNPDRAQQVAASDLGRHYTRHSNIDIKLVSYFAENCWFPGRRADLNWGQQLAVFDLGGQYSLCPNMENLDVYFSGCLFFCWFPADGVGPD